MIVNFCQIFLVDFLIFLDYFFDYFDFVWLDKSHNGRAIVTLD